MSPTVGGVTAMLGSIMAAGSEVLRCRHLRSFSRFLSLDVMGKKKTEHGNKEKKTMIKNE